MGGYDFGPPPPPAGYRPRPLPPRPLPPRPPPPPPPPSSAAALAAVKLMSDGTPVPGTAFRSMGGGRNATRAAGNDLAQHYVDTGDRPQNFIRDEKREER